MGQLITFKTAKLAKEKGFSPKTKKFYNTRIPEESEVVKTFSMKMPWNTFSDNPYTIAIVPQSLLQKWLREKHNLDANVITKHKDLGKFYGGFVDTNNGEINKSYGSNFRTYEEALEKGLKEGLKLIE